MTYYNQIGYNTNRGDNIQIIKTKSYSRDLRKKIISKNLTNEYNKICKIETIIKGSENFKTLIHSPLSKIYNINKKSGNLREYYTASINSKIRLYIKPVGDYPYDLAQISIVEFNKIDDKHYGEG